MELKLEVGRTYFRLTFADSGMTMPGAEPLVYLGDTDPSDGAISHIFQDTVSYVRFGSRLAFSQDQEDMLIYFIPPGEIGSGIVDVQHLAAEVSAAAQRARVLNNPMLPVLREGWQSVP
jgi:hypothetical protein